MMLQLLGEYSNLKLLAAPLKRDLRFAPTKLADELKPSRCGNCARCAFSNSWVFGKKGKKDISGNTAVPKTTLSPLRRIKQSNFHNVSLADPGYDHLGNSISSPYGERFSPPIDHNNAYLPPVI
jgi:hypothetical protein